MGAVISTQKEQTKNPFDLWKNKDLGEKLEEVRKALSKFCKDGPLRIVICGPTSAGKSATVNNILSARREKVVQVANVGGRSQHVTEKYKEYILLQSDENTEPLVVICDTCGIDQETEETNIAAVKEAVKGKPCNDQDVICSRQSLAAYIIVVIDAVKVKKDIPVEDTTNSVIFQRMTSILDFAISNEIPLSVFLTKCDILDDTVSKDIKALYISKMVESVRKHVHRIFQGLPIGRIFPIVNYTDQLKTDEDMMLHTLFALKCIVDDVESSIFDVVRHA